MRIVNTVKCQALAVKSEKSKDGTKEYHKLSILLNDESGMISCSDSVADKWNTGTVKCMDTVNLTCEYNDQYQSYRVIDIAVAKA